MYSRIRQFLETDKLNLIEYKLRFANYSYNPLKTNVTRRHKADTWARVSTQHGQTLLSLAFNYGVLSLMTLTFGTTTIDIELADAPVGCFELLGEPQMVELVQQLLMRDFRENETSIRGTERICHEIVMNHSGYAKFTDWCCYIDAISGRETCETSTANEWLRFLYVLLSSIRFGVMFFGPLMFFSAVGSLTREEVPYTVKLKEPLVRTLMLCNTETFIDTDIKVKQQLDFRSKKYRDLPKLIESMHNVGMKLPPLLAPPAEFLLRGGPIGQPFPAKISEYDITVNYKRLLTENKVPIGLWKTVIRSIFYCKLRNVGPFVDCCRQNMFQHMFCSCVALNVPWVKFWRKVGLGLAVLLLPTPYYVRLVIFYLFEYEEVMTRKEAAAALGLRESYENSLVQYLLPTHPLFVCMYVVYFVMAITLAYMARRTEEGRFRKVIVGAFTDLKTLSWIDVLHMMVSNIIWPFKRYGVVGFLVVFVYWPIALPITLAVYVFYCLPTIYLTIRMLFYSRRAFLDTIQKRSKRRYRIRRKVDNSLQLFVMDNIFRLLWGDDDDDDGDRGTAWDVRRRRDAGVRRHRPARTSDGYELDEVDNLNPERLQRFRSLSVASTIVHRRVCNWRRVLENIFASTLCVIALYSTLAIMSECVGCLVEIMVFTMMGIIVNAGTLLKYIALVILVVVYSYDCFNNVEKRYLKLNKALFNEVKGRIKDLEKVTSLPSYLQENRGFKSQELSEQADYEMPDDVAEKPARHWLINDLVLFIDNEDMPRIPRKLFEDVCEIRVAGVPGPVYLGLLFALKQFLKIGIFVGFIFLVILSFGNVYGLSSTNQMIAALAGGSLPLIMRTFMEPEKPDIEMGTVSFRSKLDEIIKNFAQYWPIYDFSFELHNPEEEDQEKKDAGGGGGGGDGGPPAKESADDKNAVETKETTYPGYVNETSLERRPIFEATPNGSDTMISTVYREQGESKPVGGNDRPNSVVGVTKSEKKKLGLSMSGNGGTRVCFKEEEEVPERQVDLLIYLPPRNDDENWLDEWSDLGNDGQDQYLQGDEVFDKNKPKILNARRLDSPGVIV